MYISYIYIIYIYYTYLNAYILYIIPMIMIDSACDCIRISVVNASISNASQGQRGR
jgi:hypothetical protein